MYLRFILILSSFLGLNLPSFFFDPSFPIKILYEFIFSPYVLHIQSIQMSLFHSSILEILKRLQTDFGAHIASYPMSIGDYFPVGKVAGARS
jgi:hypothetical protein